MAQLVFYVLGVVAVVSALLCILQKNPVASAMWLVNTMFALAGMYVLLGAQFIGAIQVLVYAGAVMVLFLFVIMLLNLDRDTGDIRGWSTRLVTGALVAAFVVVPGALVAYTPHRLLAESSGAPAFGSLAAGFPAGAGVDSATAVRGVVGAIAEPLFRDYLVPFEMTSVLLLAAAVGAVVLAKRKL